MNHRLIPQFLEESAKPRTFHSTKRVTQENTMARNLSLVLAPFFALSFVVACDGGEDADLTGGHTPADIETEAGTSGSAGSAGQAGSGGAAGSDAGSPCSPKGATLPCEEVCPGGTQKCLDDGTFADCVCPDSGASGSGGSAGSSGSGGSAGSGGTAGQAGSGGSSGQAGSGGSAGQAGSGGSAGAGGSPPFSVECDQYGEQGEIVLYMKAPLPDGNGLMMSGWIDFPNWMGSDVDSAWGLWSLGDANDNTVALLLQPEKADGTPLDVVTGTVLEMAPGNHPAPTSATDQVILANANYYCGSSSCSTGTFVVCDGNIELCGIRDGALKGGMSYLEHTEEVNGVMRTWVNLVCTVD
jgi:hypothetical protein